MFSEILKTNRSRFNAKFAEARRRWPRLDAEAFGAHLRAVVAPVVEAAPGDKAAAVAEALYDLSLDLFGLEILGPAGRYPLIAESWQTLLPCLSGQIASVPRLVAGSITNALYNLSLEPGARPTEWPAMMAELADVCPDASDLLLAGQVAAWRAGMAHYRRSALELCHRLSPPVACVALGLPPAAAAQLPAILNQLSSNPWLLPLSIYQPSAPSPQSLAPKVVARVGAFRGFGGVFVTPPLVLAAETGFMLYDDESFWQLNADVFGATLRRVEPAAASPANLKLPGSWKTRLGKNGLSAFPEFESVSSLAANETTLAVATPLSHAVYLVAMMEY